MKRPPESVGLEPPTGPIEVPGVPASAGQTRSVDRAIALLTAALTSQANGTLSELAQATGLSTSTALRLLASLCGHGLVQRSIDGRYRAGPRMKQLAAASLNNDPLYDFAGPHLEAIVKATGETASLGQAHNAESVVYIRQRAPRNQAVQSVLWTGRRIPRRDTALGNAIDGIVNADGFAVSRRSDSDVAAAAAPVYDHRNEIVGALSINAPAFRTTDADLAQFGAVLVYHAHELSRSLGARID